MALATSGKFLSTLPSYSSLFFVFLFLYFHMYLHFYHPFPFFWKFKANREYTLMMFLQPNSPLKKLFVLDMGNYFTTIFPSGRFKEQDCSENPLPKPATGSKTPIMSKADASDAFDPRSPSHNVSRTPLKYLGNKSQVLIF